MIPVLEKALCSKSLKFSLSLPLIIIEVLIFFCLFCKTAAVSYVFLIAQEIGVLLARIDTLVHA